MEVSIREETQVFSKELTSILTTIGESERGLNDLAQHVSGAIEELAASTAKIHRETKAQSINVDEIVTHLECIEQGAQAAVEESAKNIGVGKNILQQTLNLEQSCDVFAASH